MRRSHQPSTLSKQEAKEMMGPQVHQPPLSVTSTPPWLSVLRFPSTGIKNTHRLGANRRLRPDVHFFAWPARIHPPRGVQRGPSRFPARPLPLSLGKLAAARCRGLFLGVEGGEKFTQKQSRNWNLGLQIPNKRSLFLPEEVFHNLENKMHIVCLF